MPYSEKIIIKIYEPESAIKKTILQSEKPIQDAGQAFF
tara:strand:+ start:322 stop:435 length:114 start_codon:yes stop_codon:yes gene_type:complete